MRERLFKSTRSRRSGLARGRAGHAVPPRPTRPEPVAPPAEVERARTRDDRTGAAEDREVYHCSCGVLFQGDVSASASCPRCGREQAW